MDSAVLSDSRVSSTRRNDASALPAETHLHSFFTQEAQDISHKLLEEWHKAPVKTAVEVIVPLAIGAFALTKGYDWFETAREIKTADPLRSLIRIEGYGGTEKTALAMEKIVAGARAAIANKSLTSGEDVEQFIAKKYMDRMYKLSKDFDREYFHAGPNPKHMAYGARFDKLVAASEYTASTRINGKDWKLMESRKPSWRSDRIRWSFYEDDALKGAVKGRVNQLFDEVMSTRTAPQSGDALHQNLSRVAELEWLNANLWKYNRGSSGVSQLEARTWLEAAGIDSGRFKANIDPNLEALTLPLDDFQRAYPTFFEKAPNYFGKPVPIPQAIPETELTPNHGLAA